MWHNGSKRFLLVLIACSFLMLLILFLTGIGLIVLDWRVRVMWKQNLRMEQNIRKNTKSLTRNQEQIKSAEDRIINEGNERWLAFQMEHPAFAVPLVNPNEKTIDIKPATASPTPTAKPSVVIQRHTVIIHKRAPTPKPFFHW